MPTYEYVCTSCGHRLEIVQRITEDPLEICEVCGGQMRRVFHPVGVLFKGSGFYSTDSKSSKNAKFAGDGGPRESKDSETKASSESSEKKAAESKSAERPGESS